MRYIIMLGAAALVLTACGKGGAGSAAAPEAAAPTTTATTTPEAPSAGGKAGRPAWAKEMAAVPLETSMDSANGGLLAYYVDAKPAEVMAYYDRQAAAAGLKKINDKFAAAEGATGGVWSSDPAGAATSKRLTVTAMVEGGRNRVDVLYRKGG